MGRRARDTSERCRSALWAKRAWLDSRLSLDRIDMLLLDGMSREEVLERGRAVGNCRRVLNRIYRRGDALDKVPLAKRQPLSKSRPPSKPRPPPKPRKAVHLAIWAAEKDEAFAAAREDYFNPLWELLAANEPAPRPVISAVLAEAMDRVGVSQVTADAIRVGLQLCGTRFPIRVGDDDQIRDGARIVAGKMSLDAVLVLTLQCRLAAAAARYGHAQIYREALESSVHAFGQSLDEPHLAGLLMELIDKRLLQNIWIPSKPSDWPHAYLYEKGQTRVDRERWRQRSREYFCTSQTGRLPDRDEDLSIPMVRLDPRLEWFIENGNEIVNSMLAEKVGGRDDLLPGLIPKQWRETLETARHLFGEPEGTGTYIKIFVEGFSPQEELEIAPVLARTSLPRRESPRPSGRTSRRVAKKA